MQNTYSDEDIEYVLKINGINWDDAWYKEHTIKYGNVIQTLIDLEKDRQVISLTGKCSSHIRHAEITVDNSTLVVNQVFYDVPPGLPGYPKSLLADLSSEWISYLAEKEKAELVSEQ